MAAKIIWSLEAKEDLQKIYEYIQHSSNFYAAIFISKVTTCSQKLCSFPLLGRVVPEYQNENIREIIFWNYRMIYKILTTNLIAIVSVANQKQLLV